MSIRQVVYLSAALKLMDARELELLLVDARERNGKLGITGLLLYSEGNFIQVIEGEPASVEQLFRRIKRDPRHRQFLVMLDHMVTQRDFDGWNMGFEQLSSNALVDESRLNGRAAAHRLIESFRRTTVTRY